MAERAAVVAAGRVRLAPVAPGAREPVRAEAGGAVVGGSAHAGAAVQAAQGGAGRGIELLGGKRIFFKK